MLLVDFCWFLTQSYSVSPMQTKRNPSARILVALGCCGNLSYSCALVYLWQRY